MYSGGIKFSKMYKYSKLYVGKFTTHVRVVLLFALNLQSNLLIL